MDAEASGDGPRTGYGRSWAAAGEVDTFDQFDWGADEKFRLESGTGECAA